MYVFDTTETIGNLCIGAQRPMYATLWCIFLLLLIICHYVCYISKLAVVSLPSQMILWTHFCYHWFWDVLYSFSIGSNDI